MKRGFTLIELLAVIILLSIIGMITFQVVDKTIKNNKDKLYDIQIDNIKDGFKTWVNAHIEYAPTNNDEVLTITLANLKKDGVVKADLKNPKTNRLFPNDMFLVVKKLNGAYVYDVLTDTGIDDGIFNDQAPLIILTCEPNLTVTGSEGVQQTGYVMFKDGTVNEISGNLIENGALSTDTTGYTTVSSETYKFKMTATDNDNSFTITRTITVE